jgi:predicted transcriptional regulator
MTPKKIAEKKGVSVQAVIRKLKQLGYEKIKGKYNIPSKDVNKIIFRQSNTKQYVYTR